MKKPLKKLAFGAAVAAAAFQFSACRNRPEAVYGPPEYFNKETTNAETQTAAQETTDAGTQTAAQETTNAGTQPAALDPTGFKPEENEPVCVYGPPEWFGDRESDAAGTPVLPSVTPETDPDFDPEANMNEDVYGPPEMFDPDEGKTGEAEGGAPAEEKK